MLNWNGCQNLVTRAKQVSGQWGFHAIKSIRVKGERNKGKNWPHQLPLETEVGERADRDGREIFEI